MKRREFMRFAGSALAAPIAVLGGAARAGRKKRPNIIFLMSDQQRWDCIGRLNPMVKTPALDSVAREGVVFDQAVCQGPMCVPSRYSMMLGLYPSQVGVLRNRHQLSDAQLPCEPLPEILRKAGYQTAGFGKTHWGGGGRSTRGFTTRFIGQPSNVLYEEGAVMMGDKNPEGLARYQAETKDYGGGEENIAGYIGETSAVAEEDHRDGWVFRQCLDFLEDGVDKSKPLFLYLSFLKPHAGHNVPPGFEELYNIDEIPIPEQPPVELAEPCHATGTNRESVYRPFWRKATKQQWRQMRLRYYANCSWIDSMFGRVLDKLKAKGLLDNSLVIYVSDHGEMLGERYYRFNKYCLFDSSVRVPIILGGTVVPASRRGKVDHRPAELVDVLPTLLKVAGLDVDSTKPGRDLLGPSTKQATFCELHEKQRTPSFMWRRGGYKLILTMNKPVGQSGYESDDILSGELYDLKADPREWRNLYDDGKHMAVRRAMSKVLLQHIRRYLIKATKASDV